MAAKKSKKGRKTPSMAAKKQPKNESQSKVKPFRLLDLPAELQLNIIDHAVSSQGVISIPRETHPPALAQVCRSLRHDILRVYYKQNFFEISYCVRHGHMALPNIIDWFKAIDAKYRKHLRTYLFNKCIERHQEKLNVSIETCVDRLADWLRKREVTFVLAGKEDGHTLWRILLHGE